MFVNIKINMKKIINAYIFGIFMALIKINFPLAHLDLWACGNSGSSREKKCLTEEGRHFFGG